MDVTSVGIGGGAVGALSTVFWWLLRRSIAQSDQRVDELKEAIEAQNETIKEQGKALDAHKLHVAEHYVTQNELTKAVESLDKTMQRLIEAVNQNAREAREGFSEIHRRIDGKADKD